MYAEKGIENKITKNRVNIHKLAAVLYYYEEIALALVLFYMKIKIEIKLNIILSICSKNHIHKYVYVCICIYRKMGYIFI